MIECDGNVTTRFDKSQLPLTDHTTHCLTPIVDAQCDKLATDKQPSPVCHTQHPLKLTTLVSKSRVSDKVQEGSTLIFGDT